MVEAAMKIRLPLNTLCAVFPSGQCEETLNSIPAGSVDRQVRSLAVKQVPPANQTPPAVLTRSCCAFVHHHPASTRFISATRETQTAIHIQPSDPSLASGTHGL